MSLIVEDCSFFGFEGAGFEGAGLAADIFPISSLTSGLTSNNHFLLVIQKTSCIVSKSIYGVISYMTVILTVSLYDIEG